MFAAGSLMALLMVGYVMDGFLSERPPASDDEDDAPENAHGDMLEADDATGASDAVIGSDLLDLIFGTEGHDAIAGGDGDDTILGGPGNDALSGGAGNDEIFGGAGADTLDGDAGDDHLIFGAGDHATGGAGSDMFEVTQEAVASDGTAVAYVADFDPESDRLILDFDGGPEDTPEITLDPDSDPGNLLVLANGAPVTMLAGVTSLDISAIDIRMSEAAPTSHPGPFDGAMPQDPETARAAFEGFHGPVTADAMSGSNGADSIDGTPQGDLVYGYDGMDTLSGQDGIDVILGDAGADLIDGGGDADFLAGGTGDDTVTGGAGDDMLFGQAGDDVLRGGDGNDAVQGGPGADRLEGGAGDDLLDGTFASGAGAQAVDGIDTLTGGDGDDTLILGEEDIATGGLGADTFVMGADIEQVDIAGRVADFDPAQDRIEVMFDPGITPNPEITLEPGAEGVGTHVMLDGEIILYLDGDTVVDPSVIELRDVTREPAAEMA